MATRETCNFSYTTSLDKRHTIRIQNPAAVITPATAAQAAGRFLMANPFNESIGNLTDFKGAERVSITRTTII